MGWFHRPSDTGRATQSRITRARGKSPKVKAQDVVEAEAVDRYHRHDSNCDHGCTAGPEPTWQGHPYSD
jgi:hypothetical protein